MEINYQNTQNFPPTSINNTLQADQGPLGTHFRSYELNGAINHYLLDPFQYSITKFDYYLPNGKSTTSSQQTSDQGLVYRDVKFDTLLPTFTAVKKSVNDFSAQDYHRFLANDGYFTPNEGTNNTDLWYYGAKKENSNVGGAALNVQEVKHIIFPESQRGGTDSKNLAKYSWTSKYKTPDNSSWESFNYQTVNNNENCNFFNYNDRYNSGYKTEFNKAYQFDSNYTRNIGISAPESGSMPYAPGTST